MSVRPRKDRKIMFLRRKAVKRALITAVILCATYGLYSFYICEPQEYRNNRYKL